MKTIKTTFLMLLAVILMTVPGLGFAEELIPDIDEDYFYETPALNGIDVLKLQSNPEGETCFLLWVGGPNMWSGSISLTPPDIQVFFVFNTLAEDFYPLNVNITTDHAVYETYASDKRAFGTFSSTGGASEVGVFGTKDTATCEFSVSPYVPAHEIGHTMGLGHDAGYKAGDWPIGLVMGSGTAANSPIPEVGPAQNPPLAHWYNGYDGGDKTDDVVFMGNILGFVEDDYTAPNSLLGDADGTITPADNHGGIQSNTDSDEWTFIVEEDGVVEFNVKPAAVRSPNLFVGIKILDSDGETVATGVPSGKMEMESTIESITLNEGKYTLVIEGIAPPGIWINSYSSFGAYRIFGSITGMVEDTDVDAGTGEDTDDDTNADTDPDTDTDTNYDSEDEQDESSDSSCGCHVTGYRNGNNGSLWSLIFAIIS